MGSLKRDAHLIIVVGAGPAGMQVANMLSKEGHTVVILNRDAKFGGLAEYGIFPSKHRLRNGLRKNYWDILRRENVHYYGNVIVGKERPIAITDLRQSGASAIVFATGAQGTKSIGVEGENASGVFHAKDVVYHFNQLPGFSERPFEIGERVSIIGIGDVMVDIAHWLIRYKKVREVTAVVRRGPAERKYNPKEIRAICSNIDREDLKQEIARISPRLKAAGQEPDQILKEMLGEFTNCQPPVSDTRMKFRFLSSPTRVLADAAGRSTALALEDTKLERRGEDYTCIGLKQTQPFACDTVIFAVGDRVDQDLGLPTNNGNYTTNPSPTQNDPDDSLFQVFDGQSGDAIEGFFVVGWARKPSVGLVGIAKRDGDWCSEVVKRFLSTRAPMEAATLQDTTEKLQALIEKRQPRVVNKADLEILSQVETEEAALRQVEEFKFATTEEMLAAIQNRKQSVTTAKV